MNLINVLRAKVLRDYNLNKSVAMLTTIKKRKE